MLSREQFIEQRRAELRRVEDGLTRSRKELEQRSKEATVPSMGSQGDAEKDGLMVCLDSLESCNVLFNHHSSENIEMLNLPPELS